MLVVPTSEFPVSTSEHNGKLDVHADWVEASALFASSSISRAEILDALIENQTYQKQDFANEWITNVFRELERRFDLLGEAGILLKDGDRIHRSGRWEERPAYAFCMALSVLPYYREEVEARCGSSFEEQGSLFERLCEESLRAWRWEVAPLGWSKSTPKSITSRVAALAAAVGEPANEGATIKWTSKDAKDAGVDLVSWQGFPDGWGGRPICLVQCASGANWRAKLHTPNIRTWEKLLDFSTAPRRALAMPFSPGAEEFRLHSNVDDLMLLMDRHRLLSPSRKSSGAFPSTKLGKDLVTWTRRRVAAFPREGI